MDTSWVHFRCAMTGTPSPPCLVSFFSSFPFSSDTTLSGVANPHPSHLFCFSISCLPVLFFHNAFHSWSFLFFFFFFCVFAISWAAPVAYGGSQARGAIGAVAAGLHQSHSNSGSEPRLQPTPQLTATPDR